MTCLVGVPLAMFTAQKLREEQLTASWIMPFLPMLVLAISGSTLAEYLHPQEAGIVILISYAAWGVGLGLTHSVVSLAVLLTSACPLEHPDPVQH